MGSLRSRKVTNILFLILKIFKGNIANGVHYLRSLGMLKNGGDLHTGELSNKIDVNGQLLQRILFCNAPNFSITIADLTGDDCELLLQTRWPSSRKSIIFRCNSSYFDLEPIQQQR
jgi:hypothetical protein